MFAIKTTTAYLISDTHIGAVHRAENSIGGGGVFEQEEFNTFCIYRNFAFKFLSQYTVSSSEYKVIKGH
jgi:hypothetical protein